MNRPGSLYVVGIVFIVFGLWLVDFKVGAGLIALLNGAMFLFWEIFGKVKNIMPYHKLTQDSGGDADSRRAEADRILNILAADSIMEKDLLQEQREFLRKMFSDRRQGITTKQLFYLRDIKSAYVD